MNLPKGWENLPVVDLDNWSCGHCTHNLFSPPEMNPLLLFGAVKGHPEKSDGKRVQTSAVRDSCGCFVRTNNTIYHLKTPDPEYLKWLEKNKIPFDPENPVKSL